MWQLLVYLQILFLALGVKVHSEAYNSGGSIQRQYESESKNY